MNFDGIPFYKMHGCGNDFIFIDNRSLNLPRADMPGWARVLCSRGTGISADGLLFLDNPPADRPEWAFVWHFINSDGSEGEMCGNASRCAALLAHALGMADACHTFGTLAGGIRAEVLQSDPRDGRVTVDLPLPLDIRTGLTVEVPGQTLTVHALTVGVPHAVVFVEDADTVDVTGWGRMLRYHEIFAPAGVNVNFVEVLSPAALKVRTYERGVEDETLACGTGASASQVIARRLGHTCETAEIFTRTGCPLGITALEDRLVMTGPARLVFTGTFYPEAFSELCPGSE